MSIFWIVFFVTCIASLAIVVTQRWHGHVSADSTQGVQKVHANPTPRIGGVAVAAGLMAGYALSPPDVQSLLGVAALAAIPAFGMGLLEDISKRIGVMPRLLATIVSGVIVCWLTHTAMQNTGVPPLDWLLGYFPVAVLFTAFAVGGVANAINIIDGFNGLACGAVAIMLAAFGLIALHVGDVPLSAMCCLLIAIMLGFATVNWPMGYIFLGDGGAYLVGFLLAWVAVLLPMRNHGLTAWCSLLVCFYPVLEVAFSYRRKSIRVGHHPGQPDRVHLHMLFYRRVSRPWFPNASIRLQNGLTSPFCWLLAALPAGFAVVFADNDAALAACCVAFAIIYALVYHRLTKFRWQFW